MKKLNRPNIKALTGTLVIRRSSLLAAESGINAASYRKWAVERVKYLLGDNNVNGSCFSSDVGYDTTYSLCPHFRHTSCPNQSDSCDWDQFSATTANSHVLEGVLIGRPDQDDNYADVRTDYEKNEVAIDYDSGFQGSLAAILHLKTMGQFPTANVNISRLKTFF